MLPSFLLATSLAVLGVVLLAWHVRAWQTAQDSAIWTSESWRIPAGNIAAADG